MSAPMALLTTAIVAAVALIAGVSLGGVAGLAAGLAVVAAGPALLTASEATTGDPEAPRAALLYTGASAVLAGAAWLLP